MREVTALATMNLLRRLLTTASYIGLLTSVYLKYAEGEKMWAMSIWATTFLSLLCVVLSFWNTRYMRQTPKPQTPLLSVAMASLPAILTWIIAFFI